MRSLPGPAYVGKDIPVSPFVSRYTDSARARGTLAEAAVDQTLGDPVRLDKVSSHTLWHAEGVTKHLVCVNCGVHLQFEPILPDHLAHTVGTDMRPCYCNYHVQ